MRRLTVIAFCLCAALPASAHAARIQLGLANQAKSTISGWESGAREPKLRYLKAMATLYGVPLDLFTDPPPTAYESIETCGMSVGPAVP